jgi:putative membrane protein
MYVRRYFGFRIMYFITWRMILWSLFTGVLAIYTYRYLRWNWVAIPWLPVSLVGTAVAFYVGFKNNQSYDRCWEARMVWGGIVNLSRSFTAAAKSFLQVSTLSEDEKAAVLRTMIYRHIAWLHALKHAMWQLTPWEHQYASSRRQRNFFRKRIDFSSFDKDAESLLSRQEMEWVQTKKNKAAQLLEMQAAQLAELSAKGVLNTLRHIELQRLITELYNEQGRSERIKNFPLPRQYATSSAVFIIIFSWMLPFGMLHEFEKLGPELIWLLLPFNMVVSWVFSLMEYTGDYSENPFEGLINDVPIQSIVRNIEIDLLDMLGEKDLPQRIEPQMGVLF